MKVRNLLWASVLPLAFTACQQNEEVLAPENNNNSAVEVAGARVVENPVFYVEKADADTRMVAPGGVVEWAEGDKVGLAWLNAFEIGKNWDGVNYYSDWMPSYHLIGSNTRITYTGEDSKFSMQDGQLFEGQYICYYPYNDGIKRVDQFYFNQEQVQTQSASAVDGKDEKPFAYIANNLNWLSRETCNEAGATADKSSFMYHIDAQRSGLVENIHIPMRRYSNIAEFRFSGVEPTTSQVKWEDLTIKSYELIAEDENATGKAIFPKKATFDFSNGNGAKDDALHLLAIGSDNKYVETTSTEEDADGNPIKAWERNEDNWTLPYYVGSQKVGNSILPALTGADTEKYVENSDAVANLTLNIAEPAVVGANKDIQRAMFLTLPIMPAELEGTQFSIKVNTDYGYVVIEEAEWKKYMGKDPDPVVDGINWGNKNLFSDYTTLAASNQTVADLLSLIGQKVTRFVAVNPDELIYNNIVVNTTDDLVAAITKWNKLGKSGEFTVLACDNNKFDNLDWAADSETSEEIQKFLANENNKLIFGVENDGKSIYFGGNTNFNEAGTLTFTAPVVVKDGTLTVEDDQVVTTLTTEDGSALVVKAGQTLSDGTSNNGTYTLYGTTTIEQTAKLANKNLVNNGILTTNGAIVCESFTNNKGAEYHVLTFSTVQANEFINKGDVYYDQQGALFTNLNGARVWITNVDEGRVIATVNEGDDANTLSDYIIAANTFKCTDLVINNNDYFTSNQWDTSLSTKGQFGFIRVLMNDGVTLNFLKGVNFGKAVVTIAEGAEVKWTKSTENPATTPAFVIKKLVVKGGATLNVSDIYVTNAQITDMVLGGANVTTTLTGTTCFNNPRTQTITDEHGDHGTIVVE